MTQYSFVVEIKEMGAYTTVTRHRDGATKEFFQAGVKDGSGLIRFMNSITDDLAEGYFPRPRKEKVKE